MRYQSSDLWPERYNHSLIIAFIVDVRASMNIKNVIVLKRTNTLQTKRNLKS